MLYELMKIHFLDTEFNEFELEDGKILTLLHSKIIDKDNIQMIKDIIGEISFLGVFSGTPVFIKKGQEYFENSFESRSYLDKETHLYSQVVQNFLLNSWFVKDNSMNSAEMYGIVIQDGVVLYSSINNLDSYTMADGRFRTTTFNASEFEKLLDYQNKISNLGHSKFDHMEKMQQTLPTYISNGISVVHEEKIERFVEYGRFLRAYEFIREARKTSFVPGKLINYCCAIETLVVFEKEKINYQVKNNTKILLDHFDPNNNFSKRMIDEIYNGRSIYVHGDNFGSRLKKQLDDYSIKADEILRTILCRILDNNLENFIDSLNNSEMKEWIKSL
ncbi:HEPN domain-containing protein [Enterococcus gallinarum]|uniref:HEPN domain-containing protein n=1 Tax=Enterococcus gallinarum TaxID=1353 RepID=UPI0022E93A91|nr:HEPN domain-containing protein [Enterococcus gallinarum]